MIVVRQLYSQTIIENFNLQSQLFGLVYDTEIKDERKISDEEIYLKNLNWQQATVANVHFIRLKFKEAHFNQVNYSYVKHYNSTFEDTIFKGAEINGSFTSCKFKNCDFSRIKAKNLKFIDCEFDSDCNFDYADLRQSVFRLPRNESLLMVKLLEKAFLENNPSVKEMISI